MTETPQDEYPTGEPLAAPDDASDYHDDDTDEVLLGDEPGTTPDPEDEV